MNAVRLYLTTCRYVMQAEECVADLYRLLPYLRQALSCCVCGHLLRRPRGPEPNVCQHFVCNDCVGGKMKLKPSCSWCKDSSEFVENTQIWILVHCFKKLCEYLYSSRFVRELPSTANGETNRLVLLFQEAIAFDDNYSASMEGKLSAIPSFTTFSAKKKEQSPDFHNTKTCLSNPPSPSSVACSDIHNLTTTTFHATTAQHSRVSKVTEEISKVTKKPTDCQEKNTDFSLKSSISGEGGGSDTVPAKCPPERRKRSLWNSRGELACLSADCGDDESNSDIELLPTSSPCKKSCLEEDVSQLVSPTNKITKVDKDNRRSSWSGIIEAAHKIFGQDQGLISATAHLKS